MLVDNSHAHKNESMCHLKKDFSVFNSVSTAVVITQLFECIRSATAVFKDVMFFYQHLQTARIHIWP